MSVSGDIRNARLVPSVAEPKSERLSVSWSVANAKMSLLARARSNPSRIVHAPTGTLNNKPSPALCACDGGAIAVIAVAVSSSARSVRMIGLRCGSPCSYLRTRRPGVNHHHRDYVVWRGATRWDWRWLAIRRGLDYGHDDSWPAHGYLQGVGPPAREAVVQQRLRHPAVLR